jgi:hypothetical protein
MMVCIYMVVSTYKGMHDNSGTDGIFMFTCSLLVSTLLLSFYIAANYQGLAVGQSASAMLQSVLNSKAESNSTRKFIG